MLSIYEYLELAEYCCWEGAFAEQKTRGLHTTLAPPAPNGSLARSAGAPSSTWRAPQAPLSV